MCAESDEKSHSYHDRNVSWSEKTWPVRKAVDLQWGKFTPKTTPHHNRASFSFNLSPFCTHFKIWWDEMTDESKDRQPMNYSQWCWFLFLLLHYCKSDSAPKDGICLSQVVRLGMPHVSQKSERFFRLKRVSSTNSSSHSATRTHTMTQTFTAEKNPMKKNKRKKI